MSRRWSTVRPGPGARTLTADGRDDPAGAARAGYGWRVAAGAVFLLAFALSIISMTQTVRPTLSAPLVLPVAAGVGALIAYRVGRRERTFDLVGILLTGLAFRLLGMWFRYRNAADAVEYHEEGKRLAAGYRQFDFTAETGRPVPGTGSVRAVSGALHALFFDDLFASFAVMTLAAFAGCVLLYTAFVDAVPDADRYRYALLMMFWPTLWFWPSSLGKESLMLLGIGACALAVARMLTHSVGRGLLWFAAGLVPLWYVRPHVGLIFLAAFGVALLARRNDGQRRGRVAARLFAALALLVAGMLLTSATAERFNVDNLGTTEVSDTLGYTVQQTSQGGSGFNPVTVDTPAHFVPAAVTVLLRPFPFEARSTEALLTSLESLALVALLLASHRRVRNAFRLLRTEPYLLFSLGYVATFVYAFSAIGNFGILARQRSQVVPFILCFLAVQAVVTIERPTMARLRRRPTAEHAVRPSDGATVHDSVAPRVGPRQQRPTATARPPLGASHRRGSSDG